MELLLPILVPLLFWGGMLALLVYFTIKRISAKEQENFEDRDN